MRRVEWTKYNYEKAWVADLIDGDEMYCNLVRVVREGKRYLLITPYRRGFWYGDEYYPPREEEVLGEYKSVRSAKRDGERFLLQVENIAERFYISKPSR